MCKNIKCILCIIAVLLLTPFTSACILTRTLVIEKQTKYYEEIGDLEKYVLDELRDYVIFERLVLDREKQMSFVRYEVTYDESYVSELEWQGIEGISLLGNMDVDTILALIDKMPDVTRVHVNEEKIDELSAARPDIEFI